MVRTIPTLCQPLRRRLIFGVYRALCMKMKTTAMDRKVEGVSASVSGRSRFSLVFEEEEEEEEEEEVILKI
ncbi:hypothetical protein K1719_040322 [Acacia pycnantha]|nr:hypothetical protein K1719_040322 [Acacia pycnantha]